MHKQPTEISDKIVQNNTNNRIQAHDKNILNTFNVSNVFQKLYACSSDPFQILMNLKDDIYVIDFFYRFWHQFYFQY